MKDESFVFMSISQVGLLIRDRVFTCLDVTEEILRRIEAYDSKLKSYVTVTADQALKAACLAQNELDNGIDRGPLHGIPVALKDLIDMEGVRTTAGSAVLSDYFPDKDATVVARLKKAGAVILGKTTTYEFAYGIHSPPTVNPWDERCTPGGSSGGSAAAVACGLAYAALGTDTGGSIRIPSSLCGVTGLKPTYGRVSRAGVIPLSWSLDHVGPITRYVKDIASVLNVIAGKDARDPSTISQPHDDFDLKDEKSLSGIRIGLPTTYFYELLDNDVRNAIESALDVLKRRGASIVEVSIPSLDETLTAIWAIVLPEATLYHERYLKTHADKYSSGVRSDLEKGMSVLAVEYLKGQQLRNLMGLEFQEAFQRADVIATPTLPIPAPRFDQESAIYENGHEDIRTALNRLGCPFNLIGIPAITFPCGLSRENLPIGLQLAGPALKEKVILQVAHVYQEETVWNKIYPPDYP